MSLTFVQRSAARAILSQIQSKLNEIYLYCDFVDRMERQDWTDTVIFGIGGSISKTFTTQEQTGIHDKYAALKTDIAKFVGQLP